MLYKYDIGRSKSDMERPMWEIKCRLSELRIETYDLPDFFQGLHHVFAGFFGTVSGNLFQQFVVGGKLFDALADGGDYVAQVFGNLFLELAVADATVIPLGLKVVIHLLS